MKLAAFLIFASLSAQAADNAASNSPPSNRIPLGTAGRTSPVNQLTPQQLKAERDEVQKRLPWLDKSKYQDCGMSCLYEKGNENLSLQALYIMDKLDALDRAKLANDDAQRNRILGVYCSNSESLDSCQNRYGREQLLIMRKIRRSIALNSASAGKFKAGEKLDVKAEAPVFSMLQDADEKKAKKAQTPHIPRFSDLVAEYELETRQLRNLVSEDYASWANTLSAQPSLDDYVVTESVDREPGNPRSGKIVVVKTDSMGRPIKDLKAYRAAVDRWKKSGPQLDKDIAAFREVRKDSPNWTKDGGKLEAAKLESRNILARSRAEIVNAADNQSKQAGIQSKAEINFGGRAVSGEFGRSRPGPAGSQHQAKPDDAERLPVPVKASTGKDQFYTVVFPPEQIDKEIDYYEARYGIK